MNLLQCNCMDRYKLFLDMAAIAAHSNFFEDGFRQRDLRFLADMISNWIDYTLPEKSLYLHNTQIMRYLNDLAKEGYCVRRTKAKEPRYRLTRVGIIEISRRIAQRRPQYPLEDFYFLYHFIETYGGPIQELVASEGSGFPAALRIELNEILNPVSMVKRQKDFLDLEIKKLRQRSKDNDEVVKIISRMRREQKATDDIVTEIDRKFPYDLNNQKSLKDLYKEIPERMRNFILDIAIQKRNEQLWKPSIEVMETHLKRVETIPKLRPTEI